MFKGVRQLYKKYFLCKTIKYVCENILIIGSGSPIIIASLCFDNMIAEKITDVGLWIV
jgi:hypothetical protein